MSASKKSVALRNKSSSALSASGCANGDMFASLGQEDGQAMAGSTTGADRPEDAHGNADIEASQPGAQGRVARLVDMTIRALAQMLSASEAILSGGIELRNKAIIALLLITGIRVDAPASPRGKHVNVRSWWINQLPPEVRTKHDKHIRSYCLDLGSGMRERQIRHQPRVGLRKRFGF